jgi:RNA polymerase sigma factor (sigma-70 family)
MTPLRPIARRALAAQSDERLVRLLREGHGPAFEEIVRRYRAPLVAFATAIVSHARAEDVVQVSLEKAHNALVADDREVALRPWLFTIVRNSALNLIRAEPTTDELLAASATVPGPSEAAERSDELDRLIVAICALPDAQREALVKRELEGVGHGEIAAHLGTTATAVRGLIFRARTTLRNAVGALVPLPVLRALLAQGSVAAGVAGGGAGAGTGAALLGGAGAKGVTAIAAAVVAVGAGIAIDRGHHRGDPHEAEAAAAVPDDSHAQGPRRHASTTATGSPATADPAGTEAEASASGHGSGPSGEAESDGGGGAPSSSSGSGPSGDGGSSGSGSGSGSGSDSGSSGGSGSGGHGGPGPGGTSPPPPPPPTDSGHEGGHSGPGGGGEWEAPEPDEPESSSSGPGSGSEPEDAPELEPPELPEGEHGGHGPH